MAQEKAAYKGEYVLTNDSVPGSSTFSYLIENGDTIIDGNFLYDRISLHAFQGKKKVISIHLTGDMERSRKAGLWNYTRKTLQSGSLLRVTEYDVSYPGNGTTHEISGKFKKNKADGYWKFISRNIHHGEPVDTIKYGEIFFKNGLATEKIKLASPSIVLYGQYDQYGFSDGVWTFEYGENSESINSETRHYENGWLKNHEIEMYDKTINVQHAWMESSDSTAIPDTLSIGKKYFDILRLSKNIHLNKISNTESEDVLAVGDKSSEFLFETMSEFTRDGNIDIWSSVGETGTEMNFGTVLVNKYPYNEDELALKQQMLQTIENLENQIYIFFGNKFVEIGKHLYEELGRHYQSFEVFRNVLPVYKEINLIVANEALEYLPREEVYPYLIPEVTYPDSIHFEFNDEIIQLLSHFPPKLVQETMSYELLYAHFKALEKMVDTLSSESAKFLDKTRRQSALSDLEAEMSRKRDVVLNKFYGEEEDFNSYHKDASEYVIAFAEQIFKEYIRMDVEVKKEQIDDRIACFEDLIALYEVMTRIPRKLDRIDELYTRTVWNAFLMVDMDERVKERVYNAVISYVFPFVIENLHKQLECDKIQESTHYLENLYNRMIYLRDRDTREIERSLRRERDPEVILEIIGL